MRLPPRNLWLNRMMSQNFNLQGKMMSQSAACARCDKEDCATVVIIPALPDADKKFDQERQHIEIICPACKRSFSAPIRSIKHRDVTDEQLSRGYIAGPFFDPASFQ